MKILIYGGGAVGLGIASCLIKSGQTVDIIARRSTVGPLRKQGLLRRGIFGKFYASYDSFRAYTNLDELSETHYDIVLVSTKSFDTPVAAKDLARRPHFFKKDTRIVLCQNGWGNADVFAEYFSKNNIFNARVITGFTRPAPNEVTVTVHADSILIGSLFHKRIHDVKELCDFITRGGIPCAATKTIARDLWAKMLYNCALNPLGAILGVPYGTLGEFAYSRHLMDEIIKEVFLVMKKSGYKTHWRTPEDYRKKFYGHFLPSTRAHLSSTLQDIRSGKKTEIDALNGIVIRMAERFKMDVPVNRTVYDMVKMIEKQRQGK